MIVKSESRFYWFIIVQTNKFSQSSVGDLCLKINAIHTLQYTMFSSK